MSDFGEDNETRVGVTMYSVLAKQNKCDTTDKLSDKSLLYLSYLNLGYAHNGLNFTLLGKDKIDT